MCSQTLAGTRADSASSHLISSHLIPTNRCHEATLATRLAFSIVVPAIVSLMCRFPDVFGFHRPDTFFISLLQRPSTAFAWPGTFQLVSTSCLDNGARSLKWFSRSVCPCRASPLIVSCSRACAVARRFWIRTKSLSRSLAQGHAPCRVPVSPWRIRSCVFSCVCCQHCETTCSTHCFKLDP